MNAGENTFLGIPPKIRAKMVTSKAINEPMIITYPKFAPNASVASEILIMRASSSATENQLLLKFWSIISFLTIVIDYMKRILCTGLGGGLDIVNASLLYFAASKQGANTVLGSIRPAPLDRIKNHKPFEDCGTWVNPQSNIDYGKGIGVARYCEPRIAKAIGKDVLFLTRKYKDVNDVARLTQAIKKAKEINNFDQMFFVDGGGDSLTFTVEDADGTSQNTTDPFAGGDSLSLQALAGMKNAYLAVISVGLDISQSAFKKNVLLLKQRNAYFGRVNLFTGQKDEYLLDHIISFKAQFLSGYFKFAETIMAINNQAEKAKSHTAVVTYHAMKGSFGIQRTYVPWEPEGGILVKPEHCWMYFFDASKIHQLKIQLNPLSHKNSMKVQT